MADAQRLVEIYIDTPNYGLPAKTVADWKALRGNGYNIFWWAVSCEFSAAKPSAPKGQLEDYWLVEAVGNLIMSAGDIHLENGRYSGDHGVAINNMDRDIADPDASPKTVRLAKALLAVSSNTSAVPNQTANTGTAQKTQKPLSTVSAKPTLNWSNLGTLAPAANTSKGIESSTGARQEVQRASGSAPDMGCDEVDVSGVYHDGEVLELTDGRYLRVSDADAVTSSVWVTPFVGLICDGGGTFINKDDNETVELQP